MLSKTKEYVLRLIDHYMPLWGAVGLVIFPIIMGKVIAHQHTAAALPAGSTAIDVTKWATDANLGLLSFWLWALITNGHDGRSVKSSGQFPVAGSEKQQEFAVIIFFAGATLAVFLACHIPIPVTGILAMTMLIMILPTLVLGLPS
jgi:hypothetical protein